MKKTLLFLCLGLALLAAGCKERAPQVANADPQSTKPPTVSKAGVVTETMNAGGYTYLQLDTGTEKVWVAAPRMALQVGDQVVVPGGMAVPNHESPTLKRTFELIYFADEVQRPGAEAAASTEPMGHPPISPTDAPVDFAGIKRAEGGKTVAELYAGKDSLNGKQVAVRGKVVKASAQIMGTNWLHIQDGTGAEGTNDLTVTTSAMPKVGDTVLVTGPLVKDKDFGFGYRYDLIIENAKITVEN